MSDSWRLGYFDGAETQAYLCMRSNQARFMAFQDLHKARLRDHFYITVVPKTLDLLECCLGLLPKSLNLFLILNGLEEWEEAYVKKAYPRIPVFTLETDDGSILYDRVLDMLVECNESNFGILDQDCFVTDSTTFVQLRPGRREFAVSPFVSSNGFAGVRFPRTYFLFFNLELIKRIRDQYRLSFKRCWTIPANVEKGIASLNFGYHNFPHRALKYFDNFQLIWATAMSCGLSFGRGPEWIGPGGAEKESGCRIVHIGAGHSYLTMSYRDQMYAKLCDYENLEQLEKEKLHAAVFAHYAHLRLLESSESEELRSNYLPFFSVYKNSTHLLEMFRALIPDGRVKKIECVLGKLRQRDSLP